MINPTSTMYITSNTQLYVARYLCMKIDGKKIAEEIVGKLKDMEISKKILAAVLVGENPQSESFLAQKKKTADELGIDFRVYKLPEDLKNDGLRKEIGRIGKLGCVGGVIVQLPLPDGINTRYVLNAVPPEKDIDVLSERSGDKVLAPAVEVVKEIFEREKLNPKELKIVVMGAGKLVGGPISKWLKGNCKKLDVIDKGDSRGSIKSADVIITGVGKAGLIDPNELKNGAGVIDFGYSYDGKLSGDLKTDNENALNKLSFYTPTPGGTGPILVAKLFENFYKLCGLS